MAFWGAGEADLPSTSWQHGREGGAKAGSKGGHIQVQF